MNKSGALAALLLTGLVGCEQPDLDVPDAHLAQPLSGEIRTGADMIKISLDARIIAERLLNMGQHCDVTTDPDTNITDIRCKNPSNPETLQHELKDGVRAIYYMYPLCRITHDGGPIEISQLVAECVFFHESRGFQRGDGITHHTLSFDGGTVCFGIETEVGSPKDSVACTNNFGAMPDGIWGLQVERFEPDTTQLVELKPMLAEIGE